MLLDNSAEYALVWKRVYDELAFNPNCDRTHSFTHHVPFKIKQKHVVFDISNMTDTQLDMMDGFIGKVFIECTNAGEKIYALDWQHSAFLYDPRESGEQRSVRVEDERCFGGGYDAFFPSFYPDGDYHFFIDKDFRFGYLGHPWRQEVWIWGEILIKQIDEIYRDLGWIKLCENQTESTPNAGR